MTLVLNTMKGRFLEPEASNIGYLDPVGAECRPAHTHSILLLLWEAGRFADFVLLSPGSSIHSGSAAGMACRVYGDPHLVAPSK